MDNQDSLGVVLANNQQFRLGVCRSNVGIHVSKIHIAPQELTGYSMLQPAIVIFEGIL